MKKSKLISLSISEAEKLAQDFFDVRIKGELCELNGLKSWYEFKKGDFVLTIGFFYAKGNNPIGILSKADEVICSISFDGFEGKEE